MMDTEDGFQNSHFNLEFLPPLCVQNLISMTVMVWAEIVWQNKNMQISRSILTMLDAEDRLQSSWVHLQCHL